MPAPLRLPEGRRRGFALLFALSILVLLSVFALSFVNLTRLERLASANTRLQVQAAALAEAGVAQACGEARAAARRRTWTDAADWWATGAVFPAPPADPNEPRGHVMASNAFGGADRFEVLSLDAASKLDVNLASPALNVALEALGLLPTEVTTVLGARDARGGLRSREELRQLFVQLYPDDPDEARWRSVRDLITVHATPRLAPRGTGAGDLPWAYDVPQAPLSPVNLNAAPQVVLEAVLTRVEGRPIVAQGVGPPSEWLRVDFRAQRGRIGAGGAVTITYPDRLAREVVACRRRTVGGAGIDYATRPAYGGPFRSWAQFDAFLADLPASVLPPDERGLVLALAHADARHMGYNPDLSRRTPGGLFDKLSLTRFTTGLSLGGSGVLEVRAQGWITDKEGQVLADAEVERVVRVFTPLHFTTQAQLEAMWVFPERTTYQSMPELMPRDDVAGAADRNDGHIRLTTEWPGVPPDAIGGLSSTFRRREGPGGAFTFSRAPEPLRLGGVFAPDGVVVWRQDWARDGASLRAAAPPVSLAQQGSLEFWVKLAADQTLGTDEALLCVVIEDTPAWTPALRSLVDLDGYTIPARTGATIKVERFRGRLRATWFYWGEGGGGAVSRFVLALSERQQNVGHWQPGEWHHVTVSWRHTLQDFAAAAQGNPLTSGHVPNDGVTLWVDGSSAGALDPFDYSAMLPRAWSSVQWHAGRSVSVPTTPGVYVGGYTITPAAGQDVHSTGMTSADPLARYTNATLDDVFVYAFPVGAGGAVARNRELRFERNTGRLPARFNLPVGLYHEVGSVSAEVEVPPGCEASLTLGPTVVTSPQALAAADAEALAVPDTTHGRVVPVAVTLVGDGTTTPVLEGFTVLLLPRLQVMEETRDPP
ncbi:MAG: hypothetical protein M9894_28130 [Planctomycetes bacterium]|nr:hypothetical protein [Planctomycetota bacterium]